LVQKVPCSSPARDKKFSSSETKETVLEMKMEEIIRREKEE